MKSSDKVVLKEGDKLNNSLTYIKEGSKKGQHRRVIVKCNCGNEFENFLYTIQIGRTKTCLECSYKKEGRYDNLTTHGKSKYREYGIWIGIRDRCNNAENQDYHHYGGRGIKVCERWDSSFENFIADMGRRPSMEYSIERDNVNLGYNPSNCRWILKKLQPKNTRNTNWITYKGETKRIEEWALQLGMKRRSLHARIFRDGWTVEKAFETPVEPYLAVRYITYNDKTKPIKEWAKQVGITVTGLSDRIDKMGWDLERALTTPTQVHRKFPKIRYAFGFIN